jgi:phosphatidylglycerophosphatase A
MDTDNKNIPLTARLTATVMGVGYFPFASGTAGTIAAIPVYLVLYRLGWPLYALSWLALLALSFWASEIIRVQTEKDDPGEVVIDEVVGFLIAMFLLPPTFGNIFWAFLLFRIFDIIKPEPARFFDTKVNNGIGITMDDVVAGAYTAIVINLYHLAVGA